MLPLALLLLTLRCCSTQEAAPCPFNSMCTCRYAGTFLRDVSCLGVPAARLPDLPSQQISHVDVVGAGLEVLGSETTGAQVEALRLITNRIIAIANNTFSSMSNTLRSLDISHNQLQSIPLQQLCSMTSLHWLNLHGNQITYLPNHWCRLPSSLTNLFLGENDLHDLDHSLRNLTHLEWVTLDHNKLKSVPRGSLPESLHTLSVQNNLISEIPVRTVDQLPNLVRLYIRSNLISRIAPFTFRKKKTLDKLDMGDNYLTDLPHLWFNNSLTIRDLNLEFNYLKTLRDHSFRNVFAGRVVLANNQIDTVSDDAFGGLEDTLEYLDLEGNMIRNVSRIFKKLTKLKFLYLSNNRISVLDSKEFIQISNTLKALSLAGNSLMQIPLSLKNCLHLSHLNIGYNRISDLKSEDFKDWGSEIDTLLLMNNRIMYLNNNLFQYSPNLRELSLSFNKIVNIAPYTFVDVARSLESLEISFGLVSEEFPEEALHPLSSLLWLALDNNNIRGVYRTSIHTFNNLQYLNLDFNRISHLPEGFFNPMIHTHLRDVRLSYNILNKIQTETFSSLVDLQTVILSGNKIRYIEQKAFSDLNNIATIFITENNLMKISSQAFHNLPKLLRLDLQINEMKYFTFDAFVNTSITHPMTLNISHNKITEISCNYKSPFMKVKLLDLSYNNLLEIPVNVLPLLGNHLKKLHLGHNHIDILVPNTFMNLSHLNVLTLEHNNIGVIRRRTFVGLPQLHILDLSSNKIKLLQLGAFNMMNSLRILNLHRNYLKAITPKLFQNSKLERLDLSYNELSSIPDLEDIGFTLRELDLSFNVIEYLENPMFQKMPFLTTLSLCSNRLTFLPNNIFSGFDSLINLRLCSNPLRGNYREIFYFTPNLRTLDLSSVSLTSVPPVNIPYLVQLNLTDNLIQDFSPTSADGLPRLRSLLLRANHLTTVPHLAWYRLPLLKELDLSLNPIKEITNSSFSALRRLETLSIADLPDLERIETGSLSALRSLSTLHIQS